MDQDLWLWLAHKAEASVDRFWNRLPPWIDLDELKQEIVSRIPRLLEAKPEHMEIGYYIYCRASFEARRILSRQRKRPSELPDYGADHHGFDLIDVMDEIGKELDHLSPTEKRVLLMHYAGKKNRTIARWLGRDSAWVQATLDRLKYDLLITGDEPKPHDKPIARRMAA